MLSGLRCRFPRCISNAVSPFLVAGLAVLSCLGSAHAATILNDGGFEAAGASNTYYSGQRIDGGSWNVATGAVYIDSNDPYVDVGNNSLNLTYANLYTTNAVSQALSTTVGQVYTVNFFADADTDNTFSLLENGLAVNGAPSSIVNNGFPGLTNSSLFMNYLGTFTASSASTTLSLSAVGNPAIGSQNGSVMIDNVTVQPSTAVTPEPASLVLLLTGALGLGTMLRQRRSARSVNATA